VRAWLGRGRPWHIQHVLASGRPGLWLLAAAALLGCAGGQSGTETPSPAPDGGELPREDGGPFEVLRAPPCACALAERAVLLRATLLEIDACRVRARVEEVLDGARGLALDVRRGAELDVARVTGCGAELAVEPGELVLLVFAPGQADGTPSRAQVATWGGEHLFGSEADAAVALPGSERARLLELEACSAWFERAADDAAAADAEVPSMEFEAAPPVCAAQAP
jgi:hypothetical protein